MKICLLAILICIPGLCFTQYVEQPESVIRKKNSIGIVLNPFVVTALGASSAEVHYGLQYRRLLQDNKRLRIGTFYQWKNESVGPGVPIGRTDTSLYSTVNLDKYHTVELRTGLEWSDYRRSHDGFFGLDFILGYEKRTSREILNEYSTEAGEFSSSIYGSVLTSDTLEYYTDHYFSVGLSPYFGYRVEFKEHWEAMAWFSPEFVYVAPVKTETHGVQQLHHSNGYIGFRLRMLEMALAYRF